jgi:hypothetical protein
MTRVVNSHHAAASLKLVRLADATIRVPAIAS